MHILDCGHVRHVKGHELEDEYHIIYRKNGGKCGAVKKNAAYIKENTEMIRLNFASKQKTKKVCSIIKLKWLR